MRLVHRFAGQSSIQLALALVAVGSWVSGCGDDESAGGGGGKGGTSGTAGTAGAAGSVTGGAAGSVTGGAGGSTAGSGNGGSGAVAGSAGASAGNAGAGGSGGSGGSGGMGGEPGGGEGGVGDGGMAGTAGTAGMGGAGGEGGSSDAMCTTGNLGFELLSSAPMQQHDHLPIAGMNRTTFLAMVNTGMPLTFTLPQDGTNTHTHTLTFMAGQLTTLRNGGTIASITTAMGGPAGNMHTHTYSIECGPP